MPKNVGDLGKLIVAKALKSCPKSNKSPNLVALVLMEYFIDISFCGEQSSSRKCILKYFFKKVSNF